MPAQKREPTRDPAQAKKTRRPKRKKSRWGRRLLFAFLGFLVLLGGILGILHLPSVQRAILDDFVLPGVQDSTKLKIRIEDFWVNLLSARVEVKGLDVRTADDQKLLNLGELQAHVPLTSLFSTPVVDVELKSPEVWLAVDEKGNWNLPASEPSTQATPDPNEATALPDIQIRKLSLDQAKVHFRHPTVNLDTEPFSLEANLALARMQGGADLSFGGIGLQVAGREIPIESIALDAKSESDRVELHLNGKAPGVQLDSEITLGSLQRFDGLSGQIDVVLKPEQLPAGLVPAGVAGELRLKTKVEGSPKEPKIDLQLEGAAAGATIAAQVGLAPDSSLSGQVTIDVAAQQVPPELLPNPPEGRVRVQADLSGTVAEPQALLQVETADVALAGNPLRPDLKLRARAHARNGLQIEELRVTEGPTVARVSGTMNWLLQGVLDLDVQAPNLARYSSLAGGELAGALTVDGKVEGLLTRPDADLRLSLQNGSFDGTPLGTEGRLRMKDGVLSIEGLDVQAAEAAVRIDGQIQLAKLMDGIQEATGDLRLTGLRYQDKSLGELPLRFELQPDRAELEASLPELAIELGGSYGLQDKMVDFRVRGTDVQLGKLGPLAGVPDLSGRAQLDATLRGPADQLSAQAKLEVADLRIPQADTIAAARIEIDLPGLDPNAAEGTIEIQRLDGGLENLRWSLRQSPAVLKLSPGLNVATERFEIDLGNGDSVALLGNANLKTLQGQGQAKVDFDLSKLAAFVPTPLLGRLQATANLNNQQADVQATIAGLSVSGQPLGASELRIQASPPFGKIVEATGTLLDGQAALQARYNEGAVSGWAELRDLDLAPWLKLAQPDAPTPGTGVLAARVEIEAPELTLEAIRGRLLINKLQAQTGGLDVNLRNSPVIARLEPGARLVFEGDGLDLDLGDGDHFALRGQVDLQPLRAQGSADIELELAKLQGLTGQQLGGHLSVDTDFTATLPSDPNAPVSASTSLWSATGRAEVRNLPLGPWLPPPTDPSAQEDRDASMVASFSMSGPSFDPAQLKAKLDLSELTVRGSGLELALAQPGAATLSGGKFQLQPLQLDIGGEDRLTLQAEGTLSPFDVQASANGGLDLARIGELLGAKGASGRLELNASGRASQAEGGPLTLGPEGAQAQLNLEDVQLGPWMEYLTLFPNIKDPKGLLQGQVQVTAKGFRPEDVTAKLEIPRLELALGPLQASNPQPISLSFDGSQARIDSLELNLGEGDKVSVQGTIDAETLAMNLSLATQMQLARLAPWTGQTMEGSVQANLQLGGTPSRPELRGTVDGKDIATTDAKLASLHAEFSGAPDGELTGTENLPFPLVTGTIVAEGIEAAGISLKSLNAQIRPGQAADGSQAVQADVKLSDVRQGQQQLGDLEATASVNTAGVELKAQGLKGQVEVAASVPFAEGAEGSAQVDVRSLDLAPFLELAQLPVTLPPKGKVSASGRFTFPASNPSQLSGGFDLTDFSVQLDTAALRLDGPAGISFRDGAIQLNDVKLTSQLLDQAGAGQLSDALASGGTLTISGRISDKLDLRLNGTLLLPAIRPFVPGFESMEGSVDIAFEIRGTTAAPELGGSATLNGVELLYASPRIRIEKVEGGLTAKGRRITLAPIKAVLGGGLVSIGGDIIIGEGMDLQAALQIRALGAKLDVDEFRIETRFDANLEYTGPLASGLLKGSVQLLQTEYEPKLSPLELLTGLTTRVRSVQAVDIDPAVFGPTGDEQVVGAEPQLNLSVTAPADSITVSSSNIKATASAALQIVGRPSVIGVLGGVTVSDGELDLYSSKFEDLKGNVTFGRDPYELNPKLDLSAATVKNEETIQLLIGGTALSPTIEIRSTSNRPQMEVIRSLLSGGDSGTETSTGQKIEDFATGQATNFASKQLSSAIGVDFVLSPPPLGQEPLLFSIGKQLSDLLYFKLYKVESSDASDILEFRIDLSEKLSFEGQRTEDQSTAFRLRYRKRFD